MKGNERKDRVLVEDRVREIVMEEIARPTEQEDLSNPSHEPEGGIRQLAAVI